MAEGAMADAVAAVVTNDAVAKTLGLTAEQRGIINEKLKAGQVPVILAAVRLAEAVTAILSDPKVAKDLGLTEVQVNAVKQTVTPALIKQALTPQEIERLARSLTTGAAAGAVSRVLQDRMREFDKDGDGQLSDQERQAAMEAFRQRMGAQGRPGGGMQRGQRGGQRGGERGGQRGGQRGGERGGQRGGAQGGQGGGAHGGQGGGVQDQGVQRGPFGGGN
jgi:hypothetical protein